MALRYMPAILPICISQLAITLTMPAIEVKLTDSNSTTVDGAPPA